MSVVIEARTRHFGAKIAVASPLAGYTLGRIFLDGNISKEQLEAGDEYAETMARYYRLVGIRPPSARAQSLFSIAGHEGEVTEQMADRARKATNKMMEAERILLCCEGGPQVKQMVFNLCVMDFDVMRTLHPQQLLWLKRGLNALKDHKQLQAARKSFTTVTQE